VSIVSSAFAQQERFVPANYQQFQAAIDDSDPGDTITVTDSRNYDPISLDENLLLRADAGESPTKAACPLGSKADKPDPSCSETSLIQPLPLLLIREAPILGSWISGVVSYDRGRHEGMRLPPLVATLPGRILQRAPNWTGIAGPKTPHRLAISVAIPAILSLSAGGVWARTWNVNVDGTGNAPTIEAAIHRSSAGDTVLVGPGRYHEDFSFLGKDLVVKSLLGPASTILDGSLEDSSIVIFDNGETNAAILEGFTLTGGKGTPVGGNDTEGGAVLIRDASPLIQYNVIYSNTACWGGGIVAGDLRQVLPEPPRPILRGNTILGNSALGGGGGIMIYDSATTVEGNTIQANRVTIGDGGGVKAAINRGSMIFRGNRFIENEAGDKGGGLEAYTSRFRGPGPYIIEQNLFLRNVARGADGDRGAGGGLCLDEALGSVRWNTFYDNEGEPPCGGGAVKFLNTKTDLEFSMNIIALSSSCGIACWETGTADFGPNLFWLNDPADGGTPPHECAGSWMEEGIFADPLFCDPANDQFGLAANTPAISQGVYLGAFPGVACGSMVPTRRVSWGSLKAAFSQQMERRPHR
jgi:parallel beta-helix repeat protein